MRKHNEEIEQLFLGCLLASDRVYDNVSWMRPAFFYTPVHGRIYECIAAAAQQGRSYSPHLLAKYFESDPDLTEVGGAQYLVELSSNVLTTSGAKDYAEEIHRHHVSRQLENVAKEIEIIANDNTDAAAKMSAVESIAFNLRSANTAGDIKNAERCVADALENISQAQKGLIGLRTGMAQVDHYVKGLKPSNLYVLAGRPGMGKTALGLTIAANVAIGKKVPLFFSQEMDAGQMTQRLIARFSGVSVDDQNTSCNNDQMQKIIAAADKVKQLPIFTDETPAQRLTEILSKSRRQMRTHGLDLIVIDYLGLMQADDASQKKVHQIEEITAGLKRIAKLLKVPVLLLCQLSRALEGREDKRPILSDLRDSGAIEQDADVVMFVYRPEYYLQQTKPEQFSKLGRDALAQKMADWQATVDGAKGKAEIIIAKNRQGKLGTAAVKFDGEKQVFHD